MNKSADQTGKRVEIIISNEELNALEDYLTCKLDEDKKAKYHKMCVDIWGKLVREFDKPMENKI